MGFLPAIPVAGEVIGEAAAAGEAVEGAETAAEAAPEAGEISSHDLPQDQAFEEGRIEWDKKTLTELLHSDSVIEAISKIAESVMNTANGSAQIEGAQYGMLVQETPGYVTPQALVFCDNFQARLDDSYHSTLLAAAASFADTQLVMGFVPEAEDPDYPQE